MKGKILSCILIVVSLFCGITISGCSGNKNADVWCALSSETFLQDAEVKTYARRSLDLHGIKGETESGQIIITAKENISNVDIAVEAHKNGNKRIEADCIKVYAEKYVEIDDPYLNSGNTTITFPALVGFYPDALVPFSLYKSYKEDKIKEGENQGIWIDVEIPLTAEAGEYVGEFTVTLNRQKYPVPVTLKVYDVEMPEKVHSRSAMNIWHTQLEFGEKSNYDENTNQRYYDFLLSKRLCSAYVPKDKRETIEDFVDYMVEMALNPKVTAYKIWHNYLNLEEPTHLSLNAPTLIYLPVPERQAKYEKACEQTYNGMINVFSLMLKKNLEKIDEYPDLDLFEKAIFHFEDEPTRGYRTERTKKFSEILTKAKRDFIKSNAEEFEKHPTLKNSLLNCVRDITPTDILDESLTVSEKADGTPDYEKGDGVTLWCVHCYKVESSVAREIIKERQKYGEQFWWYNCTRTSPAPSYYLEAVTMNIRLQSWQQYEHDFKGVLYWDVVHWQDLPDNDPFKSLKYYSYGNGEGILLYPGYRYNVKTPISSIRLENIFQGQEDYEYLYMLHEYLSEYNDRNGTDYDAHKLTGALTSDLHSGSYLKKTATAEMLEERRLLILNLLELCSVGNTGKAIEKINEFYK